jgi:hypothetical protein
MDCRLGVLSQIVGSQYRTVAHSEEALIFCRQEGFQSEFAWTFCGYGTTLRERDA